MDLRAQITTNKVQKNFNDGMKYLKYKIKSKFSKLVSHCIFRYFH